MFSFSLEIQCGNEDMCEIFCLSGYPQIESADGAIHNTKEHVDGIE